MAQHTVQLNVTQSTFTDKANPNTNYGNLEYLRSGTKDVKWNGSVGDIVSRYVILINWPHDVIPPRKKIISATLALYSRRFVAAAYPYSDGMLHMREVRKDWDESTATYNNTVWSGSHYGDYEYRGDIPLNSMLYFSLWPSIIYDPNGVAIDGPWLESEYAEFNSTRASSNKPYIDVVYEDVPPDKPTLIAPIGIYKDSKSVIHFEWQYNSDVGGEQKAF
ncbi:MAG: DNRLRE domain-containing protein, partial [Firmicutes bacterium]|nr:DNRLRE domain-containing protein [Bacillota bacterium]